MEFQITDETVRSHALRGIDSVRPGRKLILVHAGPDSTNLTTVTAISEIIEMTTNELWKLIYNRTHPSNEMEKVFLYRDENGKLGYKHASDAGILPYNSATDRQHWNDTNYTLDIDALERVGFTVIKTN